MIRDIAPKELIRKDYEGLSRRERLDTTLDIEQLIFVQSMEGRAHNGAGFFHKRCYVNTTVDDVVDAIELDRKAIKAKRQALIDEIFGFARAVVEGRPRNRLVNDYGQPLLGIPQFRKREVNPSDVLKGIYIGALRDDAETRKRAEERFGSKIGCGQCYLVNLDVMEQLGHNGEILAHQGHEDEIEGFKAKNLIVEKSRLGEYADGAVRYMYIRHREGPGHSDDAAIVIAGLLYNADVALGVFLSDAVDTLEKYVLDYRDQDCEAATFIEKNFDGLNTAMDEVYELSYLAAIPEGMEEKVPDSSLRYFLSIDGETNQTAFESHMRFIEKKPILPMCLAYNRILSNEFYVYLKERLFALKGDRMTEERCLS